MAKREKRKIAVIDCETDPFEKNVIPEPFIWGYYNGDEYHQFTKTDDLIEYIKDKEEIIYAHNGGKFDFHYLKKYANLYENIMVIAGRIAKFKIDQAELRDSFCLLPVALAEYNKTVFDYKKLKKDVRHKHWKEIEKYLYDDCIDLYNFLTEFISEYGNHLTIAGCAMKNWQEISQLKEKTNQNFFNQFKKFYYGGRVECFESGIIKGEIQVADIVSAYPFAMIHNHACGKDFTITKELPKNYEQSFIAIECVAKGCFPYREKEGLSFPDDNEKRLYLVTGWEYKAAKKLGLVSREKINAIYSFQESVNFKVYIDKFFELKKQAKELGNKAQYISAKLFLNSLYGKFAANPQKYREYMVVEGEQISQFVENEGWEYSNEFCTNHLLEKPTDISKHHYYNVATAASITGFVRAYLLENIHKVEKPLYCDTDAIFFTGKHNLELGLELGKFEIEFKGDSAAIAGKKLYSIRNVIQKENDKKHKNFKIASKGVRLTPHQIYDIAKGEEKTYVNDAPVYSLKKGIYFQPRNIKKTS